MAGGDQESQDLFIQASQAYLGGNIGRALTVLDEALAAAPEGDPVVTFLLVQKVGWLRESGHPGESARALAEVTRELERLPQAGNETQWSSVRMEQGMAAHKRGDFTDAEALLAEAEELAKKSPARELILTDVYANQASLYPTRDAQRCPERAARGPRDRSAGRQQAQRVQRPQHARHGLQVTR